MNDDLDEEIIGADDGFDDFSEQSSSGSFRQSPVAKLGIVLVAILAIVVVFFFFSSEEEKTRSSVLPSGSDVTSIPGSEQGAADPAYVAAVEETNEADLQRALNEGGSTIPVPIETADARLEVPEIEEETEDPLHRWRQLQDERIKRELKEREIEEEPVTVLDSEQQSEAISQLSDSMVRQMESVLASNSEDRSFNTRVLFSDEALNNNANDTLAAGNTGGGAAPNDTVNFEEEREETVIIAAGQIYYGQLLLEANSDIPNTVLAQLVSGPLRGWRLIGDFTVQGGRIAITFNTAVNEAGLQYDVDAIMLDPKTSLPALRTHFNPRFFQRVVYPAAAAFIEGFADAVEDSGRTTVTVTGETVIQDDVELTDEQEVSSGIEEAAQEIRQIIDEASNVQPLVVIKAGTAIGVFFTDNVTDDQGNDDET